MTGGYTGSYIFSNTIFSLRMGIRSRLMGYIIAFLSAVTVVSKSFHCGLDHCCLSYPFLYQSFISHHVQFILHGLWSQVIHINILSYVPNFFFGSLLMMICLDLMFEWLIDVREKVTSAEYVTINICTAPDAWSRVWNNSWHRAVCYHPENGLRCGRG